MCKTTEKPELHFETPAFNYDELEQQLKDYEANPEGYKT